MALRDLTLRGECLRRGEHRVEWQHADSSEPTAGSAAAHSRPAVLVSGVAASHVWFARQARYSSTSFAHPVSWRNAHRPLMTDSPPADSQSHRRCFAHQSDTAPSVSLRFSDRRCNKRTFHSAARRHRAASARPITQPASSRSFRRASAAHSSRPGSVAAVARRGEQKRFSR